MPLIAAIPEGHDVIERAVVEHCVDGVACPGCPNVITEEHLDRVAK
jgi:hypothetical protein